MVILNKKGTALFVRTSPVDKLLEAQKFARDNDLQLEIITRLPGQERGVLAHDEFLLKLNTVEYYLDLKGLTSMTVLSVSGIEALERGCKVLVDTGEIVHEFTTTSFDDYVKLYRELLDS